MKRRSGSTRGGASCVRRGLIVAVCSLLAAFGAPAGADADDSGNDYADALAQRAVAQGLHESETWRALLHYEQRPLRGLQSQAASPRFFLDAEGRRNPERELVATLRSFFETEPRVGSDDPPQCVFVARFHWLDSQLDFDHTRLPRLDCANYLVWRERLPDQRLTLIFAEAFLENPASMFGHTLLRLDRGQDDGSQLLGYAVDFTGDIGDDGALTYLAKGPIGIYPGYFGVGPWYERLERYADWENRDIWEYTLDLDAEEIDFFAMHLWELRGVDFPYWFFDDNCSYQLLRLLEVTRPNSRLGDGFPAQVLPVDTVRAVDRAGWVRAVAFRPSPATLLRETSGRLSGDERSLALDLSAGDASPDDARLAALPAAAQARVLGVAYEALKYDALTGRVDAAAARGRSRDLLVARSRLGRMEEETPSPDRKETRPDRGHGTSLIGLGGGVRDGDGYVELRIRPALHDLLDPAEGHAAANRVSVLDTRIRYEPERSRVRLEELVVLDVASLSPRDRFLRPVAWKFDTGLRTRLMADPSPGDDFDEKYVWRTNGGIGLAASPFQVLSLYAMGKVTLDVGSALRDDVAFGPGASVGASLDSAGDRLRTHVHAGITRFLAGDRTTWYRAGVEQRIRLTGPASLLLGVQVNRIDGDGWLEASLALAFYF